MSGTALIAGAGGIVGGALRGMSGVANPVWLFLGLVVGSGMGWAAREPTPWRVMAVKIAAQDGAPGCLLMTGYETAGGPDYQVWGLRIAQTDMRLIVSAARPEALDGDEIAVGIGDERLAVVKVVDRPPAVGPLRTAMASVGTASQRRILDRLQAGTALTFRLGATHMSGVVTESALVSLRACLASVRPNAL